MTFSLPLGWFEGLVPLVVLFISFIVWLMNQVNAKNEEQKKRQQQPRRDRPQAGAAPRPPQAGPPAPEQQVEDFLRRVLQQPAQPPGPVRGQRPAEPVVAAEVVERPSGGRGVAEHVEVYLDSDEFESRAASLTHLGQVDENVESHIHQVFDHQLGSLSTAETGAAPQPKKAPAKLPPAAGPAAGVALMLSSPDSLRSAIIMQEILRRPDFD